MAYTWAVPPDSANTFGAVHDYVAQNDPSRFAAMQSFFADRSAQAAANGGHLYGGGPGDIGWGPGVQPPDWSFDQGTAGQRAQISAVANNPNLVHGLQGSPIPEWQIMGEYPGGAGWHQGMQLPPGWQGSGQGPGFLGPPVHQGGQGPGFLGPPIHGRPPGQGPGFLGPPIHQGDIYQNAIKNLLSALGKHMDPSYKTRQQMGEFR